MTNYIPRGAYVTNPKTRDTLYVRTQWELTRATRLWYK